MVPNSCDTINVPCSHIENYYCPPDPPPPTICCIIPLQPKAVLNCSFRACSFNRRIMKVYNRNQTSGILPKQQPEANLHWLHISYFLQKCKKANPVKRICFYLKRYHIFWRPLNIAIRWSQHKNETDPIRVFPIIDLQLSSFTDIIIRNRIFKWYRPGDQ